MEKKSVENVKFFNPKSHVQCNLILSVKNKLMKLSSSGAQVCECM